MARIDDKLNLVVPVERDKGIIYIHSTPIGRDAFEANFRLLAATHADLFGRGGGYAMIAPKIAALTLRDYGKRLAVEAGVDGDGGAGALLAEMKRLSVVAVPTKDGWRMLPVDAAISQGFMDADDWLEVESAIAFFTSVSWISNRREAASASDLLAKAIGLSTTSSSPSEWMSSLPQSTEPATSGDPPASAATDPAPARSMSSVPS